MGGAQPRCAGGADVQGPKKYKGTRHHSPFITGTFQVTSSIGQLHSPINLNVAVSRDWRKPRWAMTGGLFLYRDGEHIHVQCEVLSVGVCRVSVAPTTEPLRDHKTKMFSTQGSDVVTHHSTS